MDWVINLATTHDFPEQQIHKEYFQVETDTSGDSFEVVAERSGKNHYGRSWRNHFAGFG